MKRSTQQSLQWGLNPRALADLWHGRKNATIVVTAGDFSTSLGQGEYWGSIQPAGFIEGGYA